MLIQISDKVDQVLTVTLADILKEISNGESYFWAIFWIEGSLADYDQAETIDQIEEKINKSEGGWPVTFQGLFSFADQFYQIQEVLILGREGSQQLDRNAEGECDFTIRLVDTTFWEISFCDPSLLEKYSAKFKTVEIIDEFNPGIGFPCPHQHLYFTQSDGRQKVGVAEPLPNWDYSLPLQK